MSPRRVYARTDVDLIISRREVTVALALLEISVLLSVDRVDFAGMQIGRRFRVRSEARDEARDAVGRTRGRVHLISTSPREVVLRV